jgi:aspartyl-tRNA(Asn)/glutamyl-tRNA(Gln) amidotransferase subunit A
VGPLARTVGDAALCLNALAGYDPRDPGSVDIPAEDYTTALGGDVKGLRIGVPTTYFFEHVHPEIAEGARAALSALEAEGAELREVAIPYAEQILAVEYAICLAEASEYHRTMLRDDPELYNEDVRLFLEAGEMIPATRYIQALRVRHLMQRAWAEMFDDIDVLIGPAVAMPAVEVGRTEVDWGDGFVEALNPVYVRLSAPANVTGLPSVSVPCGFTQAGLPMSIQVMARPFGEAIAIRVADAYERMTGFTAKRPPL